MTIARNNIEGESSESFSDSSEKCSVLEGIHRERELRSKAVSKIALTWTGGAASEFHRPMREALPIRIKM